MKPWIKYALSLFVILDIILAVWAYNIYISPSSNIEKLSPRKAPKVKAATIHGGSSNKSHMTAIKKAHTQQAHQQDPKKVILDVPLINQEPDLDRGCEVTSLAMLLNDAGVDVSKMKLADKIKKVPFRDDDGVRGNPNDGFVGNMETFSQPGFGVFHGPLADLAKQYLPKHIIDMTGDSFDKIIDQLKKGIPVEVITNYTFKPVSDSDFMTWHTNDGTIKVSYDQHAVVVTGYDPNHIYVNNPLGGKNVQLDRKDFIAAWKQMGSQAISYTKD